MLGGTVRFIEEAPLRAAEVVNENSTNNGKETEVKISRSIIFINPFLSYLLFIIEIK